MHVGSSTGACLEYLLKNDVLSALERLAEADRPSGVKAEVLNVFNLLVALLDERFLVHNAVRRMQSDHDCSRTALLRVPTSGRLMPQPRCRYHRSIGRSGA